MNNLGGASFRIGLNVFRRKLKAPFVFRFRSYSVLNGISTSRNLFARRNNLNFLVRPFSVSNLKVPSMGDSITEGTVIQFMKGVGDYVDIDEVVVVIETDKTSVDVRATEAGVILKILSEVDATVEVDASLVEIDTSAPKPKSVPKSKQVTSIKDATKTAAKDPAIALDKVTTAAIPVITKVLPSETITGSRNERRVNVSRMRLKIAQRLKESQNTAVMLTTFNEIDCTNMFKMRKTHKDEFLIKHGIKLGFMSTFVKASTTALLEQPIVNAYLDTENKQMVYHDFVDISVAVASPNGLVVPVLRNTEKMSFDDIERTIAEFGRQAKEGKLALEDMAGGTFTISNGGVFGSLSGTPIINPPQAAILGMHGIFERPIAIKGEVVIRPMMNVALTYDHRIIDGRDAVLFLKKVKQCVEDPTRLLLDL